MKRAHELATIDVIVPQEQCDLLAAVAQRGHDFAARFSDVILDKRHSAFVAEGSAEGRRMPILEPLLPELDLMRRITGTFNPQAMRPDIKCDAFMRVPLNTALGFAYSFLQATRLAQVASAAFRNTEYVAYHRARVARRQGYRGPSAVVQWNALCPLVMYAQAAVAASRLNTLLSQSAPAVAQEIPGTDVYLRQPLALPSVSAARVHLH